MFTEYQEQFKIVQDLFSQYVLESEGNDEISRKALIDYLNDQDMAFVKCVQVILHVGRNPKNQGENPHLLYERTMNAFDQLKGWRSQEIEVRHMIIKIPLDVYFNNGLKYLQIK